MSESSAITFIPQRAMPEVRPEIGGMKWRRVPGELPITGIS